VEVINRNGSTQERSISSLPVFYKVHECEPIKAMKEIKQIQHFLTDHSNHTWTSLLHPYLSTGTIWTL